MREYGKDNNKDWRGEKATKEQAHYRDGTPKEHCGRCSMFRAPKSCTAVEGIIRFSGVCDYFKQK